MEARLRNKRGFVAEEEAGRNGCGSVCALAITLRAAIQAKSAQDIRPRHAPCPTWPPPPCTSKPVDGRLDGGGLALRSTPRLFARRRYSLSKAMPGRLADPGRRAEGEGQCKQIAFIRSSTRLPSPTCCQLVGGVKGGLWVRRHSTTFKCGLYLYFKSYCANPA